MSSEELMEKLEQIEKLMKEANGDKKKEAQSLTALVDPMDNLGCEGCQ